MLELEDVWINATSIGDTLPETLYTLPKLTDLNLAGADFSRTLSEGVGALSLLRYLHVLRVQDNSFNGPIPVGLDNLK
jgi:hypothetical protein